MSFLSCYVANRYPCVFCWDIADNQGGQDFASNFNGNLILSGGTGRKLPSTSKWDLVANNTEATRRVICESGGKEVKLNSDIQNWRYDITSMLCAKDCRSWLYNNILARDISLGPPLPFTTLDVSNAACKFFVSTWDRTDLVCLVMAEVNASTSGNISVNTLLNAISRSMNAANPCSCAGFVAGAGQIVPSGFGVDGEAASGTPSSGWTVDLFNGPYVALCDGAGCPTPTVVGGCAANLNNGNPFSFDQLEAQQAFDDILTSAGIPANCLVEYPAAGNFGTEASSGSQVDPNGDPLVNWNTNFINAGNAPTGSAVAEGCLVIPTAQGLGVWTGDTANNEWGFNSFLSW